MKQVVVLGILVCSGALANATIQGELTRGAFVVSVCNVAQMTIDFTVEEIFGEPIVMGRMRWRAGPNTAVDCLSLETTVYVTIGSPNKPSVYIRLNPIIKQASAGYGARVNLSPSWDRLFCEEPGKCLSADDARALLVSNTAVSGFTVVTAPLAVRNRSVKKQDSAARNSIELLDLNVLLDETIGILPPKEQEQKEASLIVDNPNDESAASPEEASQNIMTLLANALAQYVTPPRECESSRKVANWVQRQNRCQLTFRSELSHTFTCTDDGSPQQILRSENAVVNFTNDVLLIDDPLYLPHDTSAEKVNRHWLEKKKGQLRIIANLWGTFALEKRCTGFTER